MNRLVRVGRTVFRCDLLALSEIWKKMLMMLSCTLYCLHCLSFHFVQILLKVISIALSYLLLSKPFTSAHLLGGALFVASVVIGARNKRNKDQAAPK